MSHVSGEALAAQVLALTRPILIAFDVDGTLAPIVEEPSAARVPEAIESALRQLAMREGVVLALITGRDLRQLDGMVQVPGAWRSVEHGRVVIAPGETPAAEPLSPSQSERLDRFSSAVVELGADLERKATSVGAHMRGRDPTQVASVFATLRALGEELGLEVGEGRAVLEAMLEVGDKGLALRAIHERTETRAVVFAGDDLTDFPAIHYAAGHGVGAFVASEERPVGPSVGEQLASITEVGALLKTLVLRL